MSEEQWQELVDLYVSDRLPEALRAGVESRLAADPVAAEDVRTLSATVQSLRDQPLERPDPWFVERVLGGLMREHGAALPIESEPHRHRWGN